MQDRPVTYRGIETTIVISGSRIHSILHEYLNLKKLFTFDPRQFINRSCRLVERNVKKNTIAHYDNNILQIYGCLKMM